MDETPPPDQPSQPSGWWNWDVDDAGPITRLEDLAEPERSRVSAALDAKRAKREEMARKRDEEHPAPDA